MASPASRRMMNDRSGNAIVDGRTHPVRELTGMVWVERQAVGPEMQCTPDQTVISFQRMEIELEKMTAQGFGVDLINNALGRRLKALAGRALKHDRLHDGLVPCRVCRALAVPGTGGWAGYSASREHLLHSSGFDPGPIPLGPGTGLLASSAKATCG